MTDEVGFAYVGIKPCGCVVAFSVDMPKHKRSTAKDVSGWIRDGLTVELWPIERVRLEFRGCKHKRGARQMAMGYE